MIDIRCQKKLSPKKISEHKVQADSFILKEIPGFNLYLAHSEGFIVSKQTGLPIKKIQRKDGYINVHVFIKKIAGKKKYSLKLEHRLIALAFFGNSTLEVNHKNGDKADNRIDNLEYVTKKENIAHARYVLKTWKPCPPGFDAHPSKISKEQHEQINRWFKNKVLSPTELAKFFDVNKETIMIHIRKYQSIRKIYESSMSIHEAR